jgi:hypothetical protein
MEARIMSAEAPIHGAKHETPKTGGGKYPGNPWIHEYDGNSSKTLGSKNGEVVEKYPFFSS